MQPPTEMNFQEVLSNRHVFHEFLYIGNRLLYNKDM